MKTIEGKSWKAVVCSLLLIGVIGMLSFSLSPKQAEAVDSKTYYQAKLYLVGCNFGADTTGVNGLITGYAIKYGNSALIGKMVFAVYSSKGKMYSIAVQSNSVGFDVPVSGLATNTEYTLVMESCNGAPYNGSLKFRTPESVSSQQGIASKRLVNWFKVEPDPVFYYPAHVTNFLHASGTVLFNQPFKDFHVVKGLSGVTFTNSEKTLEFQIDKPGLYVGSFSVDGTVYSLACMIPATATQPIMPPMQTVAAYEDNDSLVIKAAQ